MECVHCDAVLKNKNSLLIHQQKAKYCLKKQGKTNDKYECTYCNKKISSQHHLNVHYTSCTEKKIQEKVLIIQQRYDGKVDELEKQDKKYLIEIESLKLQIQDLQDKLENIAIKAVQGPTFFEDETVIDIDDTLSDSQFTVRDSDSDEDNDENYQLTPLEVGQGFTIEHREEDGYINVTNLCKAGGKQFKAWKRIQKTKAFLQALSTSVNIFTDVLIKTVSGGLNETRATWVHPQVAINIAQWISPQFDVNVSGWVYEIMMTGTVDITNTKSYKELRKENKTKDIKIQYLTKKYMKAQPRIKYEEQYVVYVLTTKRMKKDRVYILGKATNLTNRLSTYNKSDEHEVVYYRGCGDEETMGCVENMVFQYLKEYREQMGSLNQANRERFILPEKEETKLFSEIINKSVEFFKK